MTGDARNRSGPLSSICKHFYYVKLIRVRISVNPSCGTEPCIHRGSHLNMIRVSRAPNVVIISILTSH